MAPRNPQPQGIAINRFIAGLVSQRNPLVTPIAFAGLHVIERQDALIDGQNVEVSNSNTLQRRPGLPTWSSATFGASEYPQNFYTFRKNDGTLFNLVDTQQKVYKFTSSTFTSIFTKTATQKSNFQQVGDRLYFCNGTDAEKWDGTTTSKWGIATPVTGATLSYTSGSLVVLFGYQYVYCFKNSTTGHLSTASPVSANTGPLKNQTTSETLTIPNAGPYTLTVSHGSVMAADGGVKFQSNSVALTLVASSPAAGQYSVNTATGVYTFNVADANKAVVITYTYNLSTAAGVNIVVQGNGSTDPQVDKIELYRTLDGGSQFFLVTSFANPGAGTWSYTDANVDSALNNQIVAPLDHINDPPPAGLNNVCFYQGRMFGSVNNFLYFGAGGDCLNGVPEEAWPPANVMTMPGNITALQPSGMGLLVFTSDTVTMVLGGPDTLSYYPQLMWNNFGVLSQNCIAPDTDTLYIYNTNRQLMSVSLNNKTDVGFNVGDILLSQFNPTTSFLKVHRSGTDAGLFISDGSTTLLRYSLSNQSWGTKATIVGGVGCIASVETSAGLYTLLAGRPTGSGTLLGRSLTAFNDGGQTYTGYFTIGSLPLVQNGGQPPAVEAISLDRMPIGTEPSISVLMGDINSTFITIPFSGVSNPPTLPAGVGLVSHLYYLKNATTLLPQIAQHMQLKVSFTSEDAKNEILGVGVQPSASAV